MALQNNAFKDNKHASVQLIWQLLEKGIPESAFQEVTCVPSTWCRKSTTEAANSRSLGGKSYNSRNFDEAMMYYSTCVATAPVDSEELALAYGNRSAIHLFRKDYELCLLDLNRALNGSLPQSTRMMLLKRKAETWEKLQEQNVSRSKLREGISRVKRSDGEKANLRACERKLCYISQVGIDDVDLMIDHSLINDPIWQTKFDNTELENVSPKIELKYDEQLGPHLVAKDDIEPGETLCIDNLYSFTLHEELRLKYCAYCQVQCEALIACPHCTREMYCSNSCREKAYDCYHRIECEILPLWGNLSERPREMRLLVLRTFLRVTKQGSELANLMNSPTVCKSLDGKLNSPDVQISHENYPVLAANAVSMLRYSNYSHMAYFRYMMKVTLAIFAGLRYVQFFGNQDRETQRTGNVLNAQEYFGSLLLVYYVSLLKPQMFPVYDHFVKSLAEPLVMADTLIGYGFNPWKCLTNHSCDPNVERVVDKRHVLMYNVRSIKAGEQIAMMRDTHFTEYACAKRQNRHKDVFGQECTCRACVENWPVLVELKKCKDMYHIRDKKMIAKIKRMNMWLKRKRRCSISEDDLKTVLEFSKTLHHYLKEPSAIIYKFERYIKKVMMLKGNLSVDPQYIASLCNDL